MITEISQAKCLGGEKDEIKEFQIQEISSRKVCRKGGNIAAQLKEASVWMTRREYEKAWSIYVTGEVGRGLTRCCRLNCVPLSKFLC